MTVRAIAFHKSVAQEKMEQLFKSDAAQVFSGSTAAVCSKCQQEFAVYFPQKDDPENDHYLKELNKLIATDCRDGQHEERYQYQSVP